MERGEENRMLLGGNFVLLGLAPRDTAAHAHFPILTRFLPYTCNDYKREGEIVNRYGYGYGKMEMEMEIKATWTRLRTRSKHRFFLSSRFLILLIALNSRLEDSLQDGCIDMHDVVRRVTTVNKRLGDERRLIKVN